MIAIGIGLLAAAWYRSGVHSPTPTYGGEYDGIEYAALPVNTPLLCCAAGSVVRRQKMRVQPVRSLSD
jgi:hypothetical protein